MKKILLTAFVALIYSAAIAQSTPAASTASPKPVESECDRLKNQMDSTNLLIKKLGGGFGEGIVSESTKLRRKQAFEAAKFKLTGMQRRCMVLKCNHCSKPTTKAQ
jgi:hypothetical protein